MPQCQFLFSTVFDSRKVTKEIFSESTKEVILRSFAPEDSRSQKGTPGRGLVGPHHPQARVPPGRAWEGCGPPGGPPAPPFRLYIAPDAKTLGLSPKPPGKFRRRRYIEAKFRGTEVSVPAPCRDGEVPPEGSPSTPLPSPSPLLTPMMRSE